MLVPSEENHWTDADGNPAGGCSFGPGLCISWQNGPLGRGEDRVEPNGAFVESVIATAATRLRFYQGSRFHCEENANALAHLEAALEALDSRARRRETQGVEGTHAGV